MWSTPFVLSERRPLAIRLEAEPGGAGANSVRDTGRREVITYPRVGPPKVLRHGHQWRAVHDREACVGVACGV